MYGSGGGNQGMKDPLNELADYFLDETPLSDEVLLQLVRAARETGHRWAALAAVCEPGAEIAEPDGLLGTGAGERLFRKVHDAAETVRGTGRRHGGARSAATG
jgi:hypothetical protein